MPPGFVGLRIMVFVGKLELTIGDLQGRGKLTLIVVPTQPIRTIPVFHSCIPYEPRP